MMTKTDNRARVLRGLGFAVAAAGVAWPALAAAQDTAPVAPSDPLMEMSVSQLKGEIRTRYDAALAMTRDTAVIAANDTRYIWASEAKAQCGIALGFLKSGTKDAVSIGRCADAALRMQRQAPAMPMAQTSSVTPEICRQPIAGTVFFDFDSATPPADANQTIAFVAQNMQPCGWTGLTVTGHTDRSGSDAYNEGLSVRRANAIAGLLTGAGVPGSALTVSGRGESEPRVPTPDGERNPTNRRVEITVK
ncbi:OmpA family protein [Novosphingobium tardum]|uniref:OmpA family protein n=1 Tax=Novosphingobium tardum TaxID=1538021 RepID=A0ABV8RS36_9SPHN